MAELLEIREYLKGIYSKFDLYIEPVLKFGLSIVVLMLIDMHIGYMNRLQNPALVLIAALACSFMPVNVLVILAAVFCLLNVYALSLECAVVLFVVFTIMLLVYFRFVPSDALAVVLTPVCFALKIPYVIPVTAGLVGTPLSAISAGCGVIVYYLLDYVKTNENIIRGMESETTVAKFRYIADGMMNNKGMLVMLVAFTITVVLVYLIRRLSMDHAWTVAMFTGLLVCVIFVLVGDMTLGINVSLVAVILGALISLLLTAVIKFFVFSVDYSRTELLQFEDDEYYYYVKAVPKMTVAVPEKKVKHINQRKSAEDYPVFNQTRLEDLPRQAERPAASRTAPRGAAPASARRNSSDRPVSSRPAASRTGAERPAARPSSERSASSMPATDRAGVRLAPKPGTRSADTGRVAPRASSTARTSSASRPSSAANARVSSSGGVKRDPASGDRVIRRAPRQDR